MTPILIQLIVAYTSLAVVALYAVRRFKRDAKRMEELEKCANTNNYVWDLLCKDMDLQKLRIEHSYMHEGYKRIKEGAER